VPSTKFLFWNINRKPLAGLVAQLAEIHGVDVIVLAECDVEPAAILPELNRESASTFHFLPGLYEKILIFSRFSEEFIQPTFESEHVSIRSMRLPDRNPVLLATVHLPSKLNWSAESQQFECVELSRDIDCEEQKAGHRRTILVGDFNINPFEIGMVSSNGLNGVMSRQVASRESRTVQGREYQFFYNPMWNHLGDSRSDTAGSYFYDAGEHVNYYWNVFDQVLLRPALAERFDPGRVSIVKEVGAVSLVHANGRPDRTNGSDHLPLIFEVEF